MIKESKPYKDALFGNLSYDKIMNKLNEINLEIKPNSRKKFIPFPYVFMKLGRTCSLNKKEIWKILYTLKENGDIQFVGCLGIIIKINGDSKNGRK